MPEMKFNERETLTLEKNRLFLRDDIHKEADRIEVILVPKRKSLDQIRREFINKYYPTDAQDEIGEMFDNEKITMEV